MKKALSLFLMLCMLVSVAAPTLVLASEDEPVNLVAGKTYTISEQFRMGGADVGWGYDENADPSYPDDNYELTDGYIPGAEDATYSAACWMAFHQNTPAQKERGYGYVQFDLGAVCELSGIAIPSLKCTSAGITCPYKIEVMVSEDGENYTSAHLIDIEGATLESLADNSVHMLTGEFEASARYVEIRVISYGWAFMGEIEIYGEAGVPSAPETQKTYENTLVMGENGNYSCEVPYGYTWNVDYIDGKIAGEDNTLLTTQDAYNACNPNWAITVYAEKQEDGTYVALRDAIVTPGSAAGAGITIGENQIAFVAHSAYSNPNGENWLGKVAAMAVKAGDVFVVDMNAMTIYAVIPGEEIVLPELPAPELPENAIALDYAGYVHDSYFEIVAGDNMTVGALTALGIGAEKDMNYFYVAVVGADNVITEMYTILGRPDGVKTDVVCPEGGYIIGLNANKAGADALLSANVGDSIELYNIDVDSFRGKEGSIALENAGFAIVPAPVVEPEPDEPDVPEIPENAMTVQISHVNAYTWGVYNEMIIYGEGENSLSKLGYDCTWWIALKVENVDGVYTVTEIEGSGEAKDMVAPADGFLLYCYSNDAESYDAAASLSVGATLYYANFDWTKNAASETPIGQLYFVLPGHEHDLVHMEAVEAGCHYEGNIEHWYCTECETVWADEALTQVTNHLSVILPATGEGNLVHMDAVAPACHYEGNIEYWVCYDCEQVWADEALTQLTNIKNVVLPELGGEVVHVEAVAPVCGGEGNIEYWYCEECEQVWQDEALTQLTNIKNVVLPALEHDIIHMEAVDPACHYEGNVEHWYCTECETVWADEALTQVTNHLSVILPELGGEVVHVEAVAPDYGVEGNIEYWYCEECEQVWQDEALTQLTNIKNVVLPALEHNIIHIEAVDAGCHYNGNVEHWYCDECETVWADEALTQVTNHLSVIIPATGEGNLVHMDAVAPACHYEGNIEYWICYDCEQVWADEALTQLTNIKNVVLPELGGEVVHVEAVAATCYENGNIEYWYCDECGQVWQDEARTQLTNRMNVIVPADHQLLVHMDAVEPACHYEGNNEYWICYACETVWADEALTQITNVKNVVIPELGGEVVHVEAADATCYENGNNEYWYCDECGQVWQDEARTQLTNRMNVIVPAEHKLVVHIDAVAPACHYEGNVEYWYCDVCETVWTDEALTQISNHLSVILPELGGEVVHMDAVEAGCHYNGNIEYWYCDECDQVWADEALTKITNHLSVILPATGEGEVVHMDAVAPACHYEGNIEYWICYECEQVWTDEALTKLTNIKNVVLPELGGEVVHVEAKDPTATENGNIEHWYCEECDQVWQDEALTQITNHLSVIVPASTVYEFGDVDGNGKVDANDYFKLKRHILGTYELDEASLARADISGDGDVTAKDYLMLKSYILGTWNPNASEDAE